MKSEVFNRYEFKYNIHSDLFDKIFDAIRPYVEKDEYGDHKGCYTISNLYYDTKDYLFYNETINRLPFRQKLRLRVYRQDGVSQYAYFEIKKKYKGVVNKRRTKLSIQDAYSVFQGSVTDRSRKRIETSNPQILKEVEFLNQLYHLEPQSVLSYERQAFQGKEQKDLRITFDRNLRIRYDNLYLENGTHGQLFLPSDRIIMEVKATGRIPLWMVQVLSRYECYKQSFSKYANSYSVSREKEVYKNVI